MLRTCGPVHICLGLHTMGYQQELAVTMEAGKRIPLTPTHVAAETGLKKQNVRPAMLELQNCGLAKIEGSTHDRVKLYAWAVPRQPAEASRSNARHYFVEGAPPWLQSLFNRYRIKPPQGEVLSRRYLEAAEAASRKHREAEEVLKRTLKGNGTQGPLYKEERTERNSERNRDSSAVLDLSSSVDSCIDIREAETPNGSTTTDQEPVQLLVPAPLPPVADSTPPPGPAVQSTESESPPTSTPPTESVYASPRDELVALIQQYTHRLPDLKLVRDICDQVEIHSWTLRAYLDDIKPRTLRLRRPPTEAYFLWHAQHLGGSGMTPVAPPETIKQRREREGPCTECRGIGKVDAVYCTCRMGRDLERVERRTARSAGGPSMMAGDAAVLCRG